jgi:glucose-1-phosphate adenylyltransferase
VKKPLVMLLAGGGGTRLGELVRYRAKPAVPFAGQYRIIDFALSNVMHAGFDWVGVLSQYKPISLMRHLRMGEAWNLDGLRRGVRILPPRTGDRASDWYHGTANAIWQNLEFMEAQKPERVLILSGDHVYRMDYRKMLAEHLEREADLTIATMPVKPEEVSRFGMIWIDDSGRIVRFEEKPEQANTDLASMGVYLFEWNCLVRALREIVATGQGDDFGQHLMPRLLPSRKVCAHRFEGYWRDVGTVSSYFSANMDALNPASGLDLDGWEICTQPEANQAGVSPPTRYLGAADCTESLVSPGCALDGAVIRSLLSPGVRIGRGARVEESILFDGVTVGAGAVVRRAIVDKYSRIGTDTVLDGGRERNANREYARCQLAGMVVVGKRVVIPDGIRVGSNTVIEGGVTESVFLGDVPDGTTVRPKVSRVVPSPGD